MAVLNKTVYQTMKESETVTNKHGVARRDIFSFPINRMDYQFPFQPYTLTEMNINRFDQFILENYGSVSFYKKTILWLNGITIIDDSLIGLEINLINKKDLDNFFIKYLR